MTRRKGWEVGRGQFLPEESFRSWKSYSNALGQIGSRFRDRVFARSTVEVEMTEVRARSEHDFKKNLNWWDLIWFGIGAVVGAGIFVLTGLEARDKAGPAVLLSYVISGISALLSVFCYTEFAVEIPIAGGSFAYLRVELGDFVAFIGAGNILLESVIGGAAVSRAWTSYFATLCNRQSNAFRIHTNLAENYNELDPIAVAVLFITAILAIRSTKLTSRVNSIASVLHVAIQSKGGAHQYLPLFLIWNIWKARNQNLFDDLIPSIASLLHIILDEVNSYKVPLKSRNKTRDIGEPLVPKFPMVFFDGAAANFIGGAGICIWLNDHHFFAIKLGCGSSTNTREKLLALWASLWVAKDIGMPYLHIFGDSLVIINWAKGESTLDMVNLEVWCYNTRLLMSSFTWVDFSHVYREHNKRADILSKEGLCLAPGHLILTESYDDEFIGEDSIQLF